MRPTPTRLALIVALAATVLTAATACSGKYSAERDGKDLGQSLCDLREATSQEEARDALADVKEQLDDLAGRYTIFTAEDRADIDENLSDFAEHVAQGDDALIQQDLAVMERSADVLRESVNEVSAAAWDGFTQGLADCTQ
jgi:hypothetical protein